MRRPPVSEDDFRARVRQALIEQGSGKIPLAKLHRQLAGFYGSMQWPEFAARLVAGARAGVWALHAGEPGATITIVAGRNKYRAISF